MIEYPKIGYNLVLKALLVPFGMNSGTSTLLYNDGFDDYTITSVQSSTSYGIGGLLGLEYDLAEILEIPEFYAIANITGIYTPGSQFAGFLLDVGLERKFFVRQFGFFVALKGAINGATGEFGKVGIGNNSKADFMYPDSSDTTKKVYKDSSINLTGTSLGCSIAGGLDYQMTPDILFSLECGYQFFLPVNNWEIATTDIKSKTRYELDINKFVGDKPSPINMAGFILMTGFKFSL